MSKEEKVEVSAEEIMSTKKFNLGDKVQLSRNAKTDKKGREIAEKARSLELFVTQIDKDGSYVIAYEDYKYKLSAQDLVKPVK